MIISRTPFRISFVGGGTDLPSFYHKEDGQVLSTAIDKYVYVVVKEQLGIVEYKYRINWSRTEFKNNIEDIEHPIVREALKLFEIDFPVEITTFADIPAGTGMGSSSAFAVGLVQALFALKGQMATKYEIADLASKIEVNILQRTMGKQDHFASAYGGTNVLTFCKSEKVHIEPVFTKPETLKLLKEHLLLFYTVVKRDASEVLKAQVSNQEDNFSRLKAMKSLVDPLRKQFCGKLDLVSFGEILDQNWQLKRQLSAHITNSDIEAIYHQAIHLGAYGGKLLGAGSGGFMMILAPKKQHAAIKKAIGLYQLNFNFDSSGVRITYYDQSKVNELV
tara:strand:- start:5595 stop:6596 length:1002 start_codon:yes stop_codon:yes gene_type:complete